MHLFRSIIFSSALAGLLVGVAVTLAQQVGTAPLILRGEVYERAAEAAVPPATVSVAHDHAGATDHDHAQPAWEPSDGLERTAYSALANILTAVGFALVLCGVYALQGRPASWRTGLLWGLGGFAVFVVAPGLGLPPKLPGMPTAALEPRQAWWIATAAATALGLGLLAFRRTVPTVLLALALLAVPHLIGAPQPLDPNTTVPADLAREFIIAVTLTGLLFWGLLGPLTGAIYRRVSA